MLKPIPSLDDVACDPACAAGLPADAIAALSARCAAVQSALAAAQLARATSESPTNQDDHLLTVEDAAGILAVPQDWLYRNGKRLGLAVKLGDGTLRFSNVAIQAAIREKRIAIFSARRRTRRGP